MSEPARVALEEVRPMTNERVERLDQNILYAQKLQDALFRNNQIEGLFKEYFILDRPKDSVGGDFYLIDTIGGRKMVLVGDCTGHGPSGAMLSALCVSILKELLGKYKALSPALIITKALDKLDAMLDTGDDLIRDGMEVTLMFINESKKEIKYVTTGQYLFVYGPDANKTIRTRHIGYERNGGELTDQTLAYQEGTMIYVPTDGMKDQFGSESGRRFSIKRMNDFFENHWQDDCTNQCVALASVFDSWQGEAEDQTDDLLLVGVRL